MNLSVGSAFSRARWTLLVPAAVGILVSGCATSFTGNAMYPGGVRGCWDQCRANGMEIATFVYIGEYSTACACRPPATAAPPGHAANTDGSDGALSAAIAGVELQRRQMEQQQMQTTHAR
jgi:hypothetical protein